MAQKVVTLSIVDFPKFPFFETGMFYIRYDGSIIILTLIDARYHVPVRLNLIKPVPSTFSTVSLAILCVCVCVCVAQSNLIIYCSFYS